MRRSSSTRCSCQGMGQIRKMRPGITIVVGSYGEIMVGIERNASDLGHGPDTKHVSADLEGQSWSPAMWAEWQDAIKSVWANLPDSDYRLASCYWHVPDRLFGSLDFGPMPIPADVGFLARLMKQTTVE